MKPEIRKVLLGILLASTVIAAWLAPPPEGAIAEVVPRKAHEIPLAKAEPRSIGAGRARLLEIIPRGESEEVPVLFTYKREPTTKEKAIKVEPDSPPQAPPLPFSILGRYVDDGKESIFLHATDRDWAVREGDVIDGKYRVASISDGAMTVIYLPLGQKQTIALGDAR